MFLLKEDLMKFKMPFLKTLQLAKFWGDRTSVLDSMVADKKSCLKFKEGT